MTRGLVTARTGNLSARRDVEVIMITPTLARCSEVEPGDLVAVRIGDGRVLTTGIVPSRETGMHLAVYRSRSDVCAVVHTHSPCATAWSFLAEPLRAVVEDMAYYGVEDVPVTPPARAGSDELAKSAAAHLGAGRAVLLGHHGVLAVGATPREAVDIAEVVEHQARVAWLLRTNSATIQAVVPWPLKSAARLS